MINIQGRELFIGAFSKDMFKIGLRTGAYELIISDLVGW